MRPERSGLAAVAGAALWTATPWVRAAVYGSRPHVAAAFDAASLAGWALMAAGLSGVRAAFRDRDGGPGRAGVGLAAVGMAVVAVLEFRSVVAFARARSAGRERP